MRTPPPEVLAEWASLQNFVNPPKRGIDLVIISTILGTTMAVVVGARLWLKVIVQKKGDSADWCAAVATLSTLFYLIVACLGARRWGLGLHEYDLTPAFAISSLKVSFSVSAIANFVQGFVRFSVALFLRQLTYNYPSRCVRSMIWFVMISTVLTTVGGTLGLFLLCRPLKAFWMVTDPQWVAEHKPVIGDSGAYIVAVSAINLVLDIIVIVVPSALIWELKLPAKQKIAAWVIFAIGIVACAAAIMRIYAAVVAFYLEYDTNWYSYSIVLWTCVEFPLALICASAPALKALSKHFWEDKRRSSSEDGFNAAPTSFQSQSGSSFPELELKSSFSQRKWSQSKTGTSISRTTIDDDLALMETIEERKHTEARPWWYIAPPTPTDAPQCPFKSKRRKVGSGFGEGALDIENGLQPDTAIVVEKVVELSYEAGPDLQEEIRKQEHALGLPDGWQSVPGAVSDGDGSEAAKRPGGLAKRTFSWSGASRTSSNAKKDGL